MILPFYYQSILPFYRCGHCQALTPEWKKAAKALAGIVKVGAADVDQHQALGNEDSSIFLSTIFYKRPLKKIALRLFCV